MITITRPDWFVTKLCQTLYSTVRFSQEGIDIQGNSTPFSIMPSAPSPVVALSLQELGQVYNIQEDVLQRTCIPDPYFVADAQLDNKAIMEYMACCTNQFNRLCVPRSFRIQNENKTESIVVFPVACLLTAKIVSVIRVPNPYEITITSTFGVAINCLN